MSTPEEELINSLILDGAVEVAGIDAKTGEFLYAFTDKLETVNPKLFRDMVEGFHKSVLALWEFGFFDIDMESASPKIKATTKVFDEDAVNSLDKDLHDTLQRILNMMRI